jgi:hypothetical protein
MILAARIQGYQLTQWRQAALQLPAHLTIFAQQKNFHKPCCHLSKFNA